MSARAWQVTAAATASAAVAASMLLPALTVGSDPSFPDLVCASVTLTCGLLLLAEGRAGPTGLLLLATAATWSLPLLDLAVDGPAGRVLAAGALVHLATLAAAVLVTLAGDVPSPLRIATAVTAAAAALSGAVGGYRVTLPALGAVVGLSAVRGRGPARQAGVVLAALLLGEAAVRAMGVEAEQTLFALHAVGVSVVAILVMVAVRRTPSDSLRFDLDTAGLRDLDESLADALGSPGLRVWFAGVAGDWLDALGRPVEEPPRTAALVTDPVDRARVAALDGLRGDLPDRLLTTLRVVRDHARLRGAATDQLMALAASQRRLLVAGDDERHDLERRLRVGPVRHVDAVATATAGRPELDDVRRRAGLTRAALLEVARGLDPLSGSTGLAGALTTLAADAPVRVDVACGPETDRADDAVRRTVWFVCSEGVTNASKHAPASRVRIVVRVVHGRVETLVEDDGPGGADADGLGLRGLADRARAMGGRLAVDSPAGRGTRLMLDLPVASGAATR